MLVSSEGMNLSIIISYLETLIVLVMTPVGSIETLYPKLCDTFGQAMLVGLVGLLGLAWMKRK